MIDRPHFILELSLTNTATKIKVENPIIDTKTVIEAWHMLNAFVIDMLDDKGEEVTDEQFRELFIELCYHLIYREMMILVNMPCWEQNMRLSDKPKKRRKDDL